MSLLIGCAIMVTLNASPAWPQSRNQVRDAYIPVGDRLTSQMVRDELEKRLSLEPRNEADLWNAGYDFFRHYPQNQDTAQAIKDGFLRARGQTEDQRLILRKAAIYWEKIHDYGITNVPVGINPNNRDKMYYGQRPKGTTIGLRKPGRPHQGYVNYGWPGRYINKRAPYNARPMNPYPGKYYPGMYPP